MNNIPIVFSTLFFSVALISIILGIYIIKLNSQSDINKIFLYLCIALSVTAFGSGMLNSEESVYDALKWRRFAAVGWSFIYSLGLHFVLLFTRSKASIKQNKLCFILYLPSFISTYVFAISNNIAIKQYNLVNNSYGWINIAPNSIWTVFYFVYYSTFVFASILLLWKWKQSLEYEGQIRQTNLMLVSLIGTFVLGGSIDILSSSVLAKPLPEVTSLFIFFFVWSIYYSIKQHSFQNHKKVYDSGVIVTQKDKKGMFFHLAIGFCLAGLISIAYDYIKFSNGESVNFVMDVFKSGLLIVAGIAIYLIQLIKKESVKETLTIVLLVASIPFFTLNYLEFYSITVWVFPLLIMISSLVFSNRTLLVSSTIVAILTQRLVWILNPKGLVLVENYDHILRILVFIIGFLICSYINKIYVSKIKENDYQIKFQKMNSEISSDFISINQENFDEKINELLLKLGSFFEVDRARLFLIDYESSNMKHSHEWSRRGLNTETVKMGEIPIKVFPWWMEQLENNKVLHIENVEEMLDEAKLEKAELTRQGVKSLVSVAVEGSEKIQGFITLYSTSSFKKMPEESIGLLIILSNLISDGLSKLKSEKEIEFMAYYDNLTNLPNRILFKDRVTQSLRLAERLENFIAIIFIDLDNFKSVNDTIGHSGGDKLLKEVAKKLSMTVRKSDTVARFGGDEFMVLLNNINDCKDVEYIADNIMAIFTRPFIVEGQEFFIKASGGVANFPSDGENAETLIKNADTAMYEAKYRGKNQYSFCTLEMKEEVEMNMVLSNDLHHALERKELIVYYQPQIDLKDEKMVGVEALLRWKHPEFGMISPGVFIPIAEKNGLINKIGEWVLKTACRQNRAWQDMGLDPIIMGINLSAIQFINPYIADDIKRILKETDLDPKHLEIEITESIAIKETDFAVEVLHKLKKTGVSIAIDDFGTEYSSLSRLKHLPIDRIKIDMEFVQGIEKNEKDKAITMIIINLAKSLDLDVIAEGVERRTQLEFLNEKMCDQAQGYYYYKPMPGDELEEILKEIKSLANEEDISLEQLVSSQRLI